MLFITTAMYHEARPLIEFFHLKKDANITKFQVFKNNDICLIITGTGSTASAIATTYICTLFEPKANDLILNLGISAAGNREYGLGDVVLCHKIIEEATGRCFYPDVLFKHPFIEGQVITCSSVVENLEDENINILFDMEASGVYQAASHFFKSYQMVFLKIVSDYGVGELVTGLDVSNLISRNLDVIGNWIFQIMDQLNEIKPIFSDEEEGIIRGLSEDLKCTVTMENQLRQLLHYYKLVHGNFTGIVGDFSKKYILPCKDKPEGKKYFEELKSKLV